MHALGQWAYFDARPWPGLGLARELNGRRSRNLLVVSQPDVFERHSAAGDYSVDNSQRNAFAALRFGRLSIPEYRALVTLHTRSRSMSGS